MRNNLLSNGLTFPATSRTSYFPWLFFLIFVFIQATPAFSVDSEPLQFDFDTAQTKIKELSRQIKDGPVSPHQIESAKQQVEEFSKGAAACIEASTSQLSRLDQEIISLGPAAEHEPVEIVKERKSLTRQKQALQVTLSECRFVSTLATRLQNDLNDQNKLLQTATFFSKTPNFFDRIAKAQPSFAEFKTQTSRYVMDQVCRS